MSPQQPRPKTTRFNVCDLVEKWTPALQLRDPGFSWDGSAYGRGRTVNLDGLAQYKVPLRALLTIATTGFPSHSDMRATFIYLQPKYGLLCHSKHVNARACDEAAEAWRAMCRDVYILRKGGAKDQRIQDLIDLIELPTVSSCGSSPGAPSENLGEQIGSSSAKPDTATSPGKPLDLDEVEALFADRASEVESDEEVQIISIECKCDECLKKKTQAASRRATTTTEGPTAPEGKREATEGSRPIPIPSAGFGAQRNETLRRTRLTRKTTPSKAADVALVAKGAKRKKTRASKKTKKSEKTAKHRSEQSACNIKMPLRLVCRVKKGRSAYILGGGKYVAGQSEIKCSEYLTNVRNLMQAINKGEVTTVALAKSYLSSRCVD